MHVLIVEDEPLAAQKLTRLLAQADSTITVQATVESVTDAARWLQHNKVDLIFLDIHLSDGLSFSIFEQVEVQTPVIFTTAYDQYAVRAFQVNSVDYLLKPISGGALQTALEKLRRWQQPATLNYRELVEALHSHEQQWQKRFMVYSGQTIRALKVEQIAWFNAHGKNVTVRAVDGAEFLIDYTMDRLQQVLNPEHFFRVNRQYIVQLDAIAAMHPYSKGRVSIQLTPPVPGNDAIVVSAEKAPSFKAWLNA